MSEGLRLTLFNAGAERGIALMPAGATLGPRKSPFHQLLWVQHGHIAYASENHAFSAGPGTVALTPPAKREVWTWDRFQSTRVLFFLFTFSRLPADWPKPSRWPLTRRMSDEDIIRPLFEFIVCNAPRYWQDSLPPTLHRAVETLLSAYLCGPDAARRPPEQQYPAPVYRMFVWMRDLMNNDTARPVTLAEVADAAGVTARHLCRSVKDCVGYSPLEVLWTYRVTRSLIALRGDAKLDAIARDHGFANAFHYSRRFSRHFGVAPSRMRLRLRQGYKPPLPDLPFM